MNMNEFVDRVSLVENLAEQIGEQLGLGVVETGRASLAVSGGSTPIALFDSLSQLDIPWQKITVILVDERWVDVTADDSNERLVRTHLLKNKAGLATFVGMKTSAVTASAGEQECEEQLQRVPRPFNVLILGMGSDGHTASLFPGAEKLEVATALDSGRTCMALAPLTAPHERMSLTLPAILEARQIYLHLVGQDKKDVLLKAMDKGARVDMPIRFVLREQSTPLGIYWAP